MENDPLRHHRSYAHLHGAFGNDTFGKWAERFARFFGTPKFILSQTVMIILWIAMNAAVVTFRWDPYPFILLNLLFSTQAAYAAPLILLAQTRQADRDKESVEASARHAQELADNQTKILQALYLTVCVSADADSDLHDIEREVTEGQDAPPSGPRESA